MNNDKKIDAFTYHIINNIDTEILNSLSSSQLTAIKNAIKANKPKERHPIDFRGVINLFFIKYYFVLFVGRDRRTSTQEMEIGRRENAALLGNISFILFVLSPIVLFVLILLYFLKIGLGINIFPNEHMGWIIGL